MCLFIFINGFTDMNTKYILIVIGSVLLLLGLLTFISFSSGRYSDWLTEFLYYRSNSIIISVIGLGTLLTGLFWKKQ